MEKEIIIDGINYVYLRDLYNSHHKRYVVALYKNGKYSRMLRSNWRWIVQNNKHIPKGYVIHHIDKNHQNDTIENLILVTRGEHNKLHADDINHYMFRKGHTYWNHNKSIEHKTKIKEAHIERRNKKRKELLSIIIPYYMKNMDCNSNDLVMLVGGVYGGKFKRKFGLSFLDFKQKITHGESIL